MKEIRKTLLKVHLGCEREIVLGSQIKEILWIYMDSVALMTSFTHKINQRLQDKIK